MIKKIASSNINLLETVKDYLRVVDNDSDTTIQMLIDSSLSYAENYTNRQFGLATFELYTEILVDGMALPKNPIKSITKIEYMDESNTYQLLDSSLYYLYEDDGIGKVEIIGDIPNYANHKYAIKITFVAGYDEIPNLLVSWLSYQVSEQFDGTETPVSKYAKNILNQFVVSKF